MTTIHLYAYGYEILRKTRNLFLSKIVGIIPGVPHYYNNMCFGQNSLWSAAHVHIQNNPLGVVLQVLEGLK